MDERYNRTEKDIDRLAFNARIEIVKQTCNIYMDYRFPRGFTYNLTSGTRIIAATVKANGIRHARILFKYLELGAVTNRTLDLHARFAEDIIKIRFPSCAVNTEIYSAGFKNTAHYRVEISCLLNLKETKHTFKRNIAGLIQ